MSVFIKFSVASNYIFTKLQAKGIHDPLLTFRLILYIYHASREHPCLDNLQQKTYIMLS